MTSLLYEIVLPFVSSALIVILITIIAEKYGSKIGGILGTLPSIVAISLLFIAINQGLSTAAESARIIPAEMGINILFLFFIILFIQYRPWIVFTGAFLLWTVASALLYAMNIKTIILSLAIYGALFISIFISVEYIKKIPSHHQITMTYTPRKILLRGILAGTVIALSVLLAHINTTLSGIFSVFPAVFSSTMIIFLKEHGPDFTKATAKAMIIGSLSVASYAVCIHFLYPASGLLVGTITGFCSALLVTLILVLLSKKIR